MEILSSGNWLVDTKVLGNEIWRWFAAGGIILLSMVVGKIISFFCERYSRKMAGGRKEILGKFLRSFLGPVGLAALGLGLYVTGILIFYTVVENNEVKRKLLLEVPFWLQACKTIIALAVTWFVYRLVDIVEIFLNHITSKTETDLDNQLVPLVRKTMRILIVIMAGLFIAQNIYDQKISAILAGLGIGGLAFALAAKDMLANLFGSVTIFADRPFKLGERIKVDGYDGMIEEVGFRSTRLRTLFGHLVTIPNSMIANLPIENIAQRPCIRRSFDVTVTYDTSPDKIKLAVHILKQMCEARISNLDPENRYHVYFTDFNSDNLAIAVHYWYTPADWWEFCQFNHDFNMELLERFNKEGIEFAFPTQTLYLRGEKTIDVNVKQ